MLLPTTSENESILMQASVDNTSCNSFASPTSRAEYRRPSTEGLYTWQHDSWSQKCLQLSTNAELQQMRAAMQQATIAMAHETACIHDELQQADTGITAAVAPVATGIAAMQQAAIIAMAHKTASIHDKLPNEG